MNWAKEVWDRIDRAVRDEVKRSRVGAQFLPLCPVLPATTTVSADSIVPTAISTTLSVDEGLTLRLNEYWVELALTPQQVEQETEGAECSHRMECDRSTAVTLVTRAANLLAQAEDLVIFQGQNAINNASLFLPGSTAGGSPTPVVHHRGAPIDSGLLDLAPGAPALPPDQVIPVPQKSPGVYGENTFAAVAKGYSVLQQNGQYGPYALVLQTNPYADAYAPLPDTLILTADRLKPLMTAGFYGTGTLPTNIPASVSFGSGPPTGSASFTGTLVSIGGNTMDRVVGLDATTAFMQQDTDGNYRFRVVERFALRIKDINAVVRLEFQ